MGGGFGAGVHSVIEPAVYDNAVSFGPNYHIVDMAVSLVDSNLASIIHSTDEFVQFLSLLENEHSLVKTHARMNNFISSQPVAAEKITQAIFNHD